MFTVKDSSASAAQVPGTQQAAEEEVAEKINRTRRDLLKLTAAVGTTAFIADQISVATDKPLPASPIYPPSFPVVACQEALPNRNQPKQPVNELNPLQELANTRAGEPRPSVRVRQNGRSQHAGMVSTGNDAYDRWYRASALAATNRLCRSSKHANRNTCESEDFNRSSFTWTGSSKKRRTLS